MWELFPFYGWEDWGSERISDLEQVTPKSTWSFFFFWKLFIIIFVLSSVTESHLARSQAPFKVFLYTFNLDYFKDTFLFWQSISLNDVFVRWYCKVTFEMKSFEYHKHRYLSLLVCVAWGTVLIALCALCHLPLTSTQEVETRLCLFQIWKNEAWEVLQLPTRVHSGELGGFHTCKLM